MLCVLNSLCVKLHMFCIFSKGISPQLVLHIFAYKTIIDGFRDTSFVYSRDLPPDFLEARGRFALNLYHVPSEIMKNKVHFFNITLLFYDCL